LVVLVVAVVPVAAAAGGSPPPAVNPDVPVWYLFLLVFLTEHDDYDHATLWTHGLIEMFRFMMLIITPHSCHMGGS